MNYNTSEDKRGKPPRRAPKWTQYFFRLRSGLLTKSQPRRSSFPGTSNSSENMELSSGTITSYTNTKNCFCVRTGEVRVSCNIDGVFYVGILKFNLCSLWMAEVPREGARTFK